MDTGGTMSTTFQTFLFLLCATSSLYFLLRTYLSIRRIRYIGYFHHYRLYMPIAGMLVSAGAAWVWVSPHRWYDPWALVLAGLVIGGRELAWAAAALVRMVAAKGALTSERSRFRDHNDGDRKLLENLRQSLESANWAWTAKRFRDAYRSAKGVQAKLLKLRAQVSARKHQTNS